MNNFTLDPRLANDTIQLGQLDNCLLLLMNNALLPWFILVPETTEAEFTDLSMSEQADLLEKINLLSGFIKNNFDITKLNIATIGNIVSQLHIHIVGRIPSDYCWPNVVWGTSERKPYKQDQIDNITAKLKQQLGDHL